MYCNENKHYRTSTDVREVLPSSATQSKHSHVIVRGFDTLCVFSGVPWGVGCVNSGICAVLILEIARTFDLFTEHTFLLKPG